jgi:hypothetical protein
LFGKTGAVEDEQPFPPGITVRNCRQTQRAQVDGSHVGVRDRSRLLPGVPALYYSQPWDAEQHPAAVSSKRFPAHRRGDWHLAAIRTVCAPRRHAKNTLPYQNLARRLRQLHKDTRSRLTAIATLLERGYGKPSIALEQPDARVH